VHCDIQNKLYVSVLYRGCADYNYLPWTVDVRLQCQYQGPFYSLWWFCNSTLCNDGLLDNRDRCGYYDRSQHVQQLSGTSERSGDKTEEKKTAAAWKGKEAIADKVNRPETYGHNQKAELDIPKPLPPINLSPAQQQAQHEAAKQASESRRNITFVHFLCHTGYDKIRNL